LYPSNILQQLNRAPLLKRICFYAFCFGSILAALVVLVQSILEYQSQKASMETCLDALVEQRIDSISEAVWKNDVVQVKAVLSSMQMFCQPYNKGERAPLYLSMTFDDGRRIQTGKMSLQGPDIRQVYPISNWKEQGAQAYWLGELRLTQNLSSLYHKVSWQALVSFLCHVFVLACTALLSALLGYFIVIKRVRMFMLDIANQEVNDAIYEMVEEENTEVSELWFYLLDFKNQFNDKYQLSQSMLIKCQNERDHAIKMSEVKSQFLAKMSHELRTPMNGLLGFSTLLLESKLEDDQREYAQTIQASLESLLYVVNDVLDLSRIESGDLNVTNIPFSLRSVVSGVTILLKNRAEAKGLAFESRISPEIPQTLRGDPVRIRQVLINLVSNAIQHTELGHVLINFELSKQENEKVLIRMAIEDSGSVPTQRARQESTSLKQGFSSELRDKRSLGLDICYQLVELMGSQLFNDSRVESGSTYWFELSMPVVKQSNEHELIDLSLAKKLRVLVIDSYELSRKITLELLQEWDIQFEAVSTAEEGIRALQNNVLGATNFNMVLCDDLLQDLSGMEACRRIKEAVSEPLQIVILCSNPQLGDAEGFFLSGANGFLSKQIRDPYLKSVMCQAYSERHKHGQEKRLVTRYTVNDASQEGVASSVLAVPHKAYVLVVEDNIINQQLVIRMLEKNACQVDLALNGFESIELFKQSNYDLVLMDCEMPDMDGYETTQIMREIEKSSPNNHRTPIVGLTTNEMEDEANRCFKVGMDESMTKPFKIAQLEMVLERYIN